MPLPAKGDPRRPLHLAVRSVRVLGVLYVLFGLCSTLPMVMMLARGGNLGGGGLAGGASVAVGSLFYLAPGLAYLVFASYLKGYRPWAITVLLVLVSINLLFMLLAAAGLAFVVGSSAGGDRTVVYVMATVVLCMLVALIQLIYHLSKSYESVRHSPFGQPVQGFQPVFPVGVQPVEPMEQRLP